MNIAVNGLIFLHLTAVAAGVGGGMAMSQVGPRLAAAGPAEREQLWPLANGITRIALIGLVVLLLTGPAALWLKFGGTAGLNGWFWAKMGLVAAGVVAVGVTEAAKARFRRGDEGAGRVLSAAGPVIGVLMLGVILCAVFAFN
jgi:uncharacterized membrane protein